MSKLWSSIGTALRDNILEYEHKIPVEQPRSVEPGEQYSTVQYSTVQYSTVQYSTEQYRTEQYSTVQYSTGWPTITQAVSERREEPLYTSSR